MYILKKRAQLTNGFQSMRNNIKKQLINYKILKGNKTKLLIPLKKKIKQNTQLFYKLYYFRA